MCSPMAPCGPDSVVMKPIFTVSAAAGTAIRAARSPTRATRVIVGTVDLLLVRLAAGRNTHGPE